MITLMFLLALLGAVSPEQEKWNKILSAEGLGRGDLPREKQIRGKRGTPERNQPKQREFSVGDVDVTRHLHNSTVPTHVPETALQSVMEAAPFAEPTLSLEEGFGLRETLYAAVEALPELQRAVFTANVLGQEGLESIAKEYGITYSAARIVKEKAKKELQYQLRDIPEIQEKLK